jgi:hypothetical protein
MSKLKIPLSRGPSKTSKPEINNVSFGRQEDLDAYYLNDRRKSSLVPHILFLLFCVGAIVGFVVIMFS